MTQQDKVIRIISLNKNGIDAESIAKKIKSTIKQIYQTVYIINEKGNYKIINKNGIYFIDTNLPVNEKKVKKVSKSIIDFNVSDGGIILLFSQPQRDQYFDLVEKSKYYERSAKLLVEIRKERLTEERKLLK